jgi:hypothetical protein
VAILSGKGQFSFLLDRIEMQPNDLIDSCNSKSREHPGLWAYPCCAEKALVVSSTQEHQCNQMVTEFIVVAVNVELPK